MIAYKHQYKASPTPETITLVPAAAKYVEQIQALACAAYGIAPELANEWFPLEQYHSRTAHFPEGQVIAVDSGHDRVVGMTSSMRFQFNPETTFLEKWDRTTGYG